VSLNFISYRLFLAYVNSVNGSLSQYPETSVTCKEKGPSLKLGFRPSLYSN